MCTCTCRARERGQNLTSTMKHGVPTTWTTATQSWPLTWQHKNFLTTCWTSAKDVCVLCGYASKTGMSDDVGRSGFRPDAPSGHYQRHLDSVLDFAERQSQFYKLQVVGTRKQDTSRSTFDMCVVSSSVTRNGPAGCSQITTSIQWSNGTPTKMYSSRSVHESGPPPID